MRARASRPNGVPISASTAAEASRTIGSALRSGTELVARVIDSLHHPLVGHIGAWQPLQAVKPAIRVRGSQCRFERILRDPGDVYSGRASALCKLVGKVNLDARDTHNRH